MKYREHRGFKISEIGVGTYSLSGVYGKKKAGEFKNMVDRAYQLGVNFFDTAHVYGDAERVLGEIVKPYRDEVYVATKIGIKENVRPDLSREYVRKCCEESLERLQTHYIDLYQVHFDDPRTPVDETVHTLNELVDEGKIRVYGVGHLPLERVKEYCDMGNVFSVLMELSAVARGVRETHLPICRRYDVRAIAFSTTGRGLLTGELKGDIKFEVGDIRNYDPLFQRENLASGLRILDRFQELSGNYGKTPVQMAIAWVLSHPEVVCALTGPSKITHLEENLGGSGWQIASQDMRNLEEFFEAEDARLKRDQRIAMGKILSERLPEEPTQALSDLVYAMETAMSLGATTEEEVVPVFRELWSIRKNLDESSYLKLKNIQLKLRNIITP